MGQDITRGLQAPPKSRELMAVVDTAVHSIINAQAEKKFQMVHWLSRDLRSKCIAADKEWVYMKVAVDLSRWHNITIPQ